MANFNHDRLTYNPHKLFSNSVHQRVETLGENFHPPEKIRRLGNVTLKDSPKLDGKPGKLKWLTVQSSRRILSVARRISLGYTPVSAADPGIIVMSVFPERKPDWDNLQVLHRNTLPPRANFHLYDNEKDALSSDILKARTFCLSGKWKFHLANSPFEAPAGFEAPTYDSSKWSEIAVPGMWQLQSFGRGPHYTNVQYPFFVNPPRPPYTDNECGSCITRFKVPNRLRDDQLRLRFEGVDSAFHVWINGREVGYSQGARNPSEFDITDLVKKDDENVLAVRVYKFCDGSYIEDQVSWLAGSFMLIG